jgi:hypothetical protein
MRERSSSTLSTRCAGRDDEVACVDLLEEQLGLDDFDHAQLDRLVARHVIRIALPRLLPVCCRELSLGTRVEAGSRDSLRFRGS